MKKKIKIRDRLIREINTIRSYQDPELPSMTIRKLRKERKFRWEIFIGKARLF